MGLASKIKNSEASSAGAADMPPPPPQQQQQKAPQPQYAQTPSAPPYYTAPPPSAPASQQYGYGGSYPNYAQGQAYAQGTREQQAHAQPYGYPAPPPYAQPYPDQSLGKKLDSTSYTMPAYPPQHSHGATGSHEAPPNYSQPRPYQPPSAQQQYVNQLPAAQQQYANRTSNNALDSLSQKLQSIIQSNGLQRFYDPARFQAVLQKVASINFAEIAAQWRIGKELAYDLAPLALYDIVFYCDDSGSMAFEENGERINDLKFILSKVSGIATLFDDDGIVVRFMNSNVNGDGVRNAADVAQLISQVRFSGATPLGTNFDRKVIQPFVLGQANSMAKPVLAIIITDGEPYGEARDTIVQVIRRAKDILARSPHGSGAFAVQIAQVGKDAKTQKFLEALDKDPVVGRMIDCTSYYEMEEEEFARKGVTLTPELWLLKMCVGAIDPEYDSKDD